MSKVQLFTHDGQDKDLEAEAFYALLEEARNHTAKPFAQERIDLVADVGRAILKSSAAAGSPFVSHFAFWIRAAALKKIAENFEKRLPEYSHARSRGLVFHLPPQNVETVFLYSWILSYLAGNANITRLPKDLSVEMRAICNLFLEKLSAAGDRSQAFVYFSSSSDISTKVSAISDARVVWGGSQKVNLFSAVPLRGGGKSIWFGDRFSFAVVDGQTLNKMDDKAHEALAQNFYNDMFIFDQMACSSPHILYVVGNEKDNAKGVEKFKDALGKVAHEKSDAQATGHVIRKMVEGMSALANEQGSALDWSDNELTMMSANPAERLELRVGGGFLSVSYLDALDQVPSLVREHDQTISYFGFERADMEEMSKSIDGQGVTRIVPVGTALDFDFIWDGYDIPFELTRLVRVS